MAEKILKYGLSFPTDFDAAKIERNMIRFGGQWTAKSDGVTYGMGLEYHFKKYWELLWPDDSQTWWTDLLVHEILKNQFTSVVGPANAGKSLGTSKIALMDWSCFPDCTTVLISSTNLPGLRSRIYGDTIKAWQEAKDRYDWFPGHVIDSKLVICNDNIEEEKARDVRNGIIGVPCKTSSGATLGMSDYAGRKNRRVWAIADELQFCPRSFLDAQNNLIGNGSNLVAGQIRDKEDKEYGKPLRGYKCVFVGNTNPTQPDNPLNYVSEPKNGWSSLPPDNKTAVWECRKLPDHPIQCVCLNFNAWDGPNTPFPVDNPKYRWLSGPHKISNYTEGSEAYWSQGVGAFKFGLAKFKIITVESCTKNNAFGDVEWEGTPTIKIGGLDAAYSGVGGDRCPVGWGEFGKCVDGKFRFLFQGWENVPVKIIDGVSAENQIAIFCKTKMEQAGVPPENFFFDGRGTLAVAMSQMWSPKVNAVEFGGKPTDRLVAPGIYTNPQRDGETRRLATGIEYYSKFVTELWFFASYVVTFDQMRGLTMDVVLDGQPREWKRVAGDKIEAETKDDMKKRTGVSPDLFDMLVVLLEGARRRGFQLSKLKSETVDFGNRKSWQVDVSRRQAAMVQSRELTYR